MNTQNAVAKASAAILARAKSTGESLDEAARWWKCRNKDLALEAMEILGSWPSSEPELAALQRVWK